MKKETRYFNARDESRCPYQWLRSRLEIGSCACIQFSGSTMYIIYTVLRTTFTVASL